MRSFSPLSIRRMLPFLCLLLMALISGCLPTERLVWSPDGRRAVVLSEDGLYLCDEQGSLSEMLLPQIRLACWFADSQHLLLMGVREIGSWEDLAQDLPKDRETALREAAEAVWSQMGKEASWDSIQSSDKKANAFADAEIKAIQLYLRDKHGLEIAARMEIESDKLRELQVAQFYLCTAHMQGESIKRDEILVGDVLIPLDLRLSPTEKAVLFTTLPEDDQVSELYAVPLQSPKQAQRLAGPVAVYPDWTPDGRSVVYVHPVGGHSVDDDIPLGVLVRQPLLTAAGDLQLVDEKEELVGLLFNITSRVRCLRDGRILFSSFDVKLPMAIDDLEERQQIYVLDPDRQSTLTRLIPHKARTRLPEDLSYFNVSPDETRLVVAGQKSSVSLFHLASGEVTTFQEPLEKNSDLRTVPVWKSNDEVCFAGADPKVDPDAKETQKLHMLLARGEQIEVLSRTWAKEVVDKWLE